MGLDERRRQKELMETTVPKFEAALQSITRANIQYNIQWDTFQTVGGMDWIEKYSLPQIEEGMRRLCVDDLSKEAVAEKINTIRLSNVKKADWYQTATIADGVLTIDWDHDGGSYFTADMFEKRLNGML